MSRKVITVTMRVGFSPESVLQSDSPAGAISAAHRSAMLENLHAVLSEHCPGLTVKGLEQLIGGDAFDEILKQLAQRKLLENPQGHA